MMGYKNPKQTWRLTYLLLMFKQFEQNTNQQQTNWSHRMQSHHLQKSEQKKGNSLGRYTRKKKKQKSPPNTEPSSEEQPTVPPIVPPTVLPIVSPNKTLTSRPYRPTCQLFIPTPKASSRIPTTIISPRVHTKLSYASADEINPD